MHARLTGACLGMRLGATVVVTLCLAVSVATAQDDLVVPFAQPAQVDGDCSDYAGAVSQPFLDSGGQPGLIHMKHDGSSLFVCMEAQAGTFLQRFASLYLDPRGRGSTWAQPDDHALHVGITDNTRSSWSGTGVANGYAPHPGIDPLWDGAALAVPQAFESIEYRVSLSGLQVGQCGGSFRIAMFHHSVNTGSGDDYGWPDGSFFDQPATWQIASLENGPCSCGGVFPAIGDATIDQTQPGATLGAGPQLRVARGQGGDARTLLAFDLGSSLPAGATIAEARLELPVEQAASVPYALEVHSLNGAWSEVAVTWDTQPAPGPSHATGTSSLVGDVLRLDVTLLATLWATGAVPQTSLALLPGSAAMDVLITSREGNGNNGTPRLVISCVPPKQPEAVDQGPADALQLADMSTLAAASTKPTQVRMSDGGGAVRFADFSVPVPDGVQNDGLTRARWFLSNYRALLRLQDPSTELQLTRRSPDDRHLFFRQRHLGIPVAGSWLAVHLEDQIVAGIAGNYVPEITLDPTPRLAADRAEAIALALGPAGSKVAGDTQLRYLNPGLFQSPDQTTYLAWRVNLRGGDPAEALYIDADSGALLNTDSRQYDLDLDLETGNNDKSDSCWITTSSDDRWFDADGVCCGASPDAEGWQAFNNIKAVDGYWYKTFGLDSYDGDGEDVEIYIHVGSGWKNAHYSESCDIFEFGDGWPVLDVLAHEYGHGLIDNLMDEGLKYERESGALNESFADLFGHNVDASNWTIGETLSSSVVSTPGLCAGSPTGTRRNMADPTRCGYPDRVSGEIIYGPGKCTFVDNDYCGVHTNSSIHNKAAYLATQGGTFNGWTVLGIGQHLAQGLWLALVRHYLGETATFYDVRGAAITAVSTSIGKWGWKLSDLCSVRNAYAATGFGTGDLDCDGVEDDVDPDGDGDGVPNVKDNCPLLPNPGQADLDKDGQGDACDINMDGDKWVNIFDNCPRAVNDDQADWNTNGKGDACEDSDGDGELDSRDNCKGISNEDQIDTDTDGVGDACDPDDDNDGVRDDGDVSGTIGDNNCTGGVTVGCDDNCQFVKNDYSYDHQADSDGDRVGNACDLCPGVASPDNRDPDHDGKANPCDADDDNDGVLDDFEGNGTIGDNPCRGGNKVACDDNCQFDKNPNQFDPDNNGIGMVCDGAETAAFIFELKTPLTIPIRWDITGGPVSLPFGVGPSDGPEDLPGGFREVIGLDMPAGFAARVVDSDGDTVAKSGPSFGATSFKFSPVPYGATRFIYGGPAPLRNGVPAPEADPTPSLLVPPPDQIRYQMEIWPLEGTDLTQEYTLQINIQETVPPVYQSGLATGSCPSGGAGGGAGLVEPGESSTLRVTIHNPGGVPVTSPLGTLVSTTPGITVTGGTATFPNIPPFASVASNSPHFTFTVDSSVPCGAPIHFDLLVISSAGKWTSHFSLPVGAEIQQAAIDLPQPILDFTMTVSEITVPVAAGIADVDVTVWLDHTFDGDLQIELMAPNQVVVPLTLNNGGSGDDYAGTTFDDSAAVDVAQGTAPFAGSFRPQAPLSLLNGAPTDGTWTLRVTDTAGGDSGTLQAWSLRIRTVQPVCGACILPLPGEVPNLSWTDGSGTGLQWTAAPDAAWYRVYRGRPQDLSDLLTSELDACSRWVGSTTSSGSILTETPEPGSMTWYLVRAGTGAGEGPAGDATAGPRIQNSSGFCP